MRPLRRAVGPIISGLQVLPSVAWVPAAIIWFGLSDATVYFVILMGAIPSIVNGLIAGVDQVPPQLRRVGTVLGATRWQLATAVILPAALPGYLAGLKQGWAFSWRSLMAAEIIAIGGTIGFGLGSMLQQSRELADLAGVLGTILVILVIGILIELLFFGPLERRMLQRRGLLVTGVRAMTGATTHRQGRGSSAPAPATRACSPCAGLRALEAADVIVADRLGARAVLDGLAAEGVELRAEVVDVGKLPGHHAVPQDAINALLVAARPRRQAASCGSRAATRTSSAAAARSSRSASEAGVEVEVVPGHHERHLGARDRRHPAHPPRPRHGLHRRHRPRPDPRARRRPRPHRRPAHGRRHARALRAHARPRRARRGLPRRDRRGRLRRRASA